MRIPSVMNTALHGMMTQVSRLSNAADSVAGGARAEARDGAATPPATDTAATQEQDLGRDYEETLLELSDAERIYRANAAVFEAGADLWDVLRAIRRD